MQIQGTGGCYDTLELSVCLISIRGLYSCAGAQFENPEFKDGGWAHRVQQIEVIVWLS